MRAPDPEDAKLAFSHTNRFAAALVVLASLMLPPGLYGTVAFTGLIADMEADARVAAESVQQLIQDTPGRWQENTAGLDSITAGWFHFDEPYGAEQLRIIDRDGAILSAIGITPAWPRTVRVAVISDGANPAGAVEIARSLRTTIVMTALLGLIGIGLASGSYVSFHVVPLRTLRFHNMTLRRRESQLAFAKTTLRAATEGSLDAILIVDSEARIVTYTQRFIDLWNVPASLLQSGDDAPVLAAVAAQIKDAAAFRTRVEYLYAHPDEESRDRVETADGRIIDRYTRSLRGPNHAYLGRIWFFRDITVSERAADALRQSEARFKAIFDNARDGIGLLNVRTQKVFKANPSFCRMVGYTADEVPSLQLSSLHPPQSMPAIALGIKRQLMRETDVAENLPMVRKDGSVFFADVAATPIDVDGEPHILGVFRDVTERKTAEERLKFANTLLQAEIESAPDAVLVVQDDLRTASYNRNFLNMFETPPGVEATHDTDTLLAATLPRMADRDGFLSDISTLRDHPEQRIHGREALLKNGRIVEYHGTTIRGPANEAYGRIWFFRDITARKQADAELRARDNLLHAVAVSATALVTAPSLDQAISEALAIVSATLQLDRVLVMERTDLRHPPSLRYAWQGASAGTIVDEAVFSDPVLMSPALLEWATQLAGGKVLTLHRSSAPAEFTNFLETLGIHSMLVVPISVDGKYWGQISFESCTAERVWRDFETEILTTLAELFGNVIQRERYVNEIANANRILQNTPTILYRLRGVPRLPMIYVSQNIRLFGYEPDVLTEAPLLYQNLIHPDDRAIVREKQAQALDGGAANGSYEFRLLTGRGDYRWVENRYMVLRDTGNRLVEIEGLLIDLDLGWVNHVMAFLAAANFVVSALHTVLILAG